MRERGCSWSHDWWNVRRVLTQDVEGVEKKFKMGARQATGAARRDVDDDVGFGGVGREISIY